MKKIIETNVIIMNRGIKVRSQVVSKYKKIQNGSPKLVMVFLVEDCFVFFVTERFAPLFSFWCEVMCFVVFFYK